MALTAAGAGVAAAGIRQAGRVESTVEAYFDAVADGRAADALSLGALPEGDRSYLTADVLLAQRDIARISQVEIGTVTRSGAAAEAVVTYRLDLQDGPITVQDSVRLDRSGWRWTMAAVAAPVSLTAAVAATRISLAGTALPSSPVLMFPGSVPLQTNSDLLGIDRRTAVVRFAASEPIAVAVAVPAAAQATLAAALDAAVTSCLDPGNQDPSCPTTVQGVRFIPGSMTGTATVPPSAAGVTYAVLPDAAGRISVSGTFQAQAQWQQLDFNNLADPQSGELTLRYQATIPALDPVQVLWGAP